MKPDWSKRDRVQPGSQAGFLKSYLGCIRVACDVSVFTSLCRCPHYDSDMTVAWIRIVLCFYPYLFESTLPQ